ncbi:MAG: hypothetical protein HW380_2933 [Magnetococcales bacterium]|nr:hypothetical protein [Magnetococcales bacterium]
MMVNSSIPSLHGRIFRRLLRIMHTGLVKPWWVFMGGRKVGVFGREYRFSAASQTFDPAAFGAGHLLEGIVAHADHVQTLAVVCDALSLPGRPVFVDVGAFHGVYAVILGKIIQEKGGQVLAVEPHAGQFAILKENVRLNGLQDTVICENVAVADYDGQGSIQGRGNESFLTEKPSSHAETVTVTTLTTLLEKHGIDRVDLLMIDVEGAEMQVLHGLPWEKLHHGKIYCEMHPFAWKRFGTTGREIGDLLREKKYRALDMFFQEHTEFRENLFYIGPVLLLPQWRPLAGADQRMP